MTVPAFRLLALVLPIIGVVKPARLDAQVPTKCLEIESILVDACNPSLTCPGSAEGENEMVRFRVGPDPIAMVDLEADWPNGTWRGLVQNASTASITAALNATITSCGQLLEPPSGTLPAGAQVLMVTSTDMCLAGNSFAALAETMYIIFQDAGNTQGHFANSPAAGAPISPVPPAGNSARTLILFDQSSGCSDTATYVREHLVNDLGSYGGQGGESDGGTAMFSWPGIPQVTYVNYGCQAPFPQLLVEPEVDGALCGGTGTVNVNGTITGGPFISVQWSGGTGTFGDPNALSTTYTAGPGDGGTVELTLCVQTDCVDPICEAVNVPAGSGPSITITPDGPLAICAGEDVVLTASGADSYLWDGGETTAAITATTFGTYTVTGTNACGTGTASVQVTQGSGISVIITGPSTICAGDEATLTASGATNYLWSTGDVTASTTIDAPGTYSVTGSSACGSTTESIIVGPGTSPSVSISGDAEFCEGGSTTLTATGTGSFSWTGGSTGTTLTVSTGGTYSVTATNGCGTASASITVAESDGPDVAITGSLGFCSGQSTTLIATGADDYTWSTGTSGASVSVNTAGPITVTGTNDCGSDQSTVTITVDEEPTVTVSGDDLLCPNGQVVLTATSNAPVTWSAPGATGPSIIVNNPGLYIATATNGCGSDTDGFEVFASPLVAAFFPSVASGVAPLTVEFNNTTTPAGASFVWDFDGEGTSTNTDPVHLFEAPGVYVITLEASLDGCTALADTVINVSAIAVGNTSGVVIPNVFTPNRDGDNDLFYVTAVNIVGMNMLIYNRWGQKVNELRRVGEAWDARSMSGDLVPDGTYFYTFTAQGADGKEYDMTGHITLLR